MSEMGRSIVNRAEGEWVTLPKIQLCLRLALSGTPQGTEHWTHKLPKILQ